MSNIPLNLLMYKNRSNMGALLRQDMTSNIIHEAVDIKVRCLVLVVHTLFADSGCW